MIDDYKAALALTGDKTRGKAVFAKSCSACHVLYANDRDPIAADFLAKYGNRGLAASETDQWVRAVDPMIPKNQPGHPIQHRFTRAIPTSQCIVCHVHPGTSVMNSYLGYMWWDMETDGRHMYPAEQKHPTSEEFTRSQMSNPNDIAARGNWSEPEFLERVSELNPVLEHTQFADFHGHGWVYRAVFKRDREGRLLDRTGNIVPHDDPEKFGKAVHLKDIHLERGMHCVDCHFSQDAHGDGLLHGEYGNAIEIGCEDCHGSVAAATDLRTSGPAAPAGGTDLSAALTPDGRRRFAWSGGVLLQRSMVEPGLEWTVPQVKDSVDPAHPGYNAKAARAKLMSRDPVEQAWGPDVAEADLAHSYDEMECYTCHTSWTPTCFGCHLSMSANRKTPMLHNEGLTTRNWTSYNFQVLRDDNLQAHVASLSEVTQDETADPIARIAAAMRLDLFYQWQQMGAGQPQAGQPGDPRADAGAGDPRSGGAQAGRGLQHLVQRRGDHDDLLDDSGAAGRGGCRGAAVPRCSVWARRPRTSSLSWGVGGSRSRPLSP